MSNSPSGVDTAGKFLAAQKQLISQTNAKLGRAQQMIKTLKETRQKDKETITNLQKQLQESKSKLAKGNFKNAGQQTIEKGKSERLDKDIKALKDRSVQINKELQKYKELATKYKSQLDSIVKDIRENNGRLQEINKKIDNITNSMKFNMKFNMRSGRRVVRGVKYPKRKTKRRRRTKRRMRKTRR